MRHTDKLHENFGQPFTMAANAFLRSEKLPAQAKVLYLVMKSLNPCFPSEATLGRMCGLHSRQVRRWKQVLKSEGLISWEKRPYKSCLYTVNEIAEKNFFMFDDTN
jgi:hypothetical protein